MSLLSNEPDRERVDAANPDPPAARGAAGDGPPEPEDALPAERPTAEGPAPGERDEAGTEASAEAGAPSSAQLHDRWLRAEAELQNLKRRSAREREAAVLSAEEGVLLELIVVLDDLERALESAREAGAAGPWIEGVELVAGRIRERLARYGVAVIDPMGQPFDPHFHEALLEIDPPEGASPGSVVQVVHRGYARGDRALRAARVVVARSPARGKG